MSDIEIKNKFDTLLKQLATERSFDVAEKVAAELSRLLGVSTTDRFLLNIPRIDAELSRFQLAPGFARQAAAYELPHDDDKPLDLKLFWVKKASKTNLSWIIGLTPNFEDALSNDYKNIGIDFVVPEACDSIIILLSNKFKVRALELKDHITPTQLEIFSQWLKLGDLGIADQNELKNNLHAKLWESFNFEPINRKFYLELVEHFSILVHHLEKSFDRKPSVMFTTRLIGRLLFIWFLKKKNLVNVDANYFSVLDPEKQREYYENKLEKLFFEVLNRDTSERDGDDKLTPYLNGGLFDRSSTDFYGDPKLTFPSGYFNQLFETLNKYNFTVDESSPEFQHVAIDPEMLGRIFESLLAEQIDENTGNSKKKATGAFYTPREIVSYMCEQSLIEYLKTKLSDTLDRDRRIDELVRMPEAIFRDQDQNKRRDWKPYRDSIIQALEGTKTESPLTVLDPAVGSGAFPMGMLHLLVKVYSRLDSKFEKDISGLKRSILSRSLYGVDIEQTAIEITRLRAWLSIIVDIPEGERVEPLPNLDFKFVCANTLIPLDNSRQETFFTDHELKDKLIAIRDDYFKTSSKVKKEKLQKDYLKLTQSASLFDNKKTQQLKSYKPFDISSSSEFYDPELMHGVNAFDVVIGNPPYVSFYSRESAKTKESTEELKLLREIYNFTKYNKKTGRLNLWMFFIERTLMLLKKSGISALIVDVNFTKDLAIDIRRYLMEQSTPREFIYDLNEFESVASGQVVILFQNDKIKNEIMVKKSLTGKAENISSEDIGPPSYQFWINTTDPVLEKLEKNRKMSEISDLDITTGVQIGGTENYKGMPIKDHFYSDTWDYTRIIPSVLVKSVQKYSTPIEEVGIVFDYDLATEITRKTKKSAVVLNKYKNFIDKEKIFIRQSAKEIVATIGKINTCGEYSLFSLISNSESINLKYILAILNSKLITYFAVKKSIILQRQGTQPQIRKNGLESLPIKIIANTGQVIFIDLVDRVISMKKHNKDADTKIIESQIDQLVYELYDLTEEEIKIVEGK